MRISSIFRKVGKFIFTCSWIVLITFLAIALVSKANGDDGSILGYQVKSVLSGSMEPGIQTGSIIVIDTKANPADYQRGDIVTFTGEEGMLITHRIQEVQHSGTQFITKGDANNGPDVSPIPVSNIVGEYSGITIPFVGYVLHFATTAQGAALLFILPGILLVSYSIITIRKALKEVKQLVEKKTA